MSILSREVPIDAAHAALLIIHVQNYCNGGRGAESEYFRQSMDGAVLAEIAATTGSVEMLSSAENERGRRELG
jgi:hypothetical protein